MSFRLDIHQRPSESVAATIDAELEAAIASLEVTDPTARPDAVHDARKRLKKARSALRLVRGDLGNRTARRLNAELRDVAASLSDRRDFEMTKKTFAGEIDRFGMTGISSPCPAASTTPLPRQQH